MTDNVEIQFDGMRAEERPALRAEEAAAFVQDLARVLRSARTGNPATAQALDEIAAFLRRHSGESVDEALRSAGRTRAKAASGYEAGRLAGQDLSSLDLTSVKELLMSDRELTKGDLIKLAIDRFGIARSRLTREGKDGIRSIIESSVRNAEALDIISTEAARAGSQRSH